jgi:hypothetical protein
VPRLGDELAQVRLGRAQWIGHGTDGNTVQ